MERCRNLTYAATLRDLLEPVAVKTSDSPSPVIRFGVFELDLRSRELHKQGMRVRLHGQPVEILAMLLEQPGQTITREELQKRLWPADTFVDFEQGLNNAMKRLRAALDDDAETPRFIETLPRRGYRLIATLERNRPPAWPARKSIRWMTVTLASILVVGLAVGGWLFHSRKAHPLTEKDTIVLADFSNSTGDPIFDDTLKQGLAVQLG